MCTWKNKANPGSLQKLHKYVFNYAVVFFQVWNFSTANMTTYILDLFSGK